MAANNTRFDVVAVGNAIVDVIAHTDDAFVAEQGLTKGAMTLIDADRAEDLYARMGPGVETSGGSVANTTVGVSSFGGRAAFIGRVRDDALGAVFGQAIRAAGVTFEVPATADGPPTARSLILVTPDAQRTMNTSLGIAALLTPADIDEELIAAASITYCEGYLWDVDVAKAAITKAMRAAKAAGRQVAFTLSDGFCVDRHRADFLGLVEGDVDIVFANESELCSLYEVDSFDDALQQVRSHCELAFLTRGAAGSVIVAGDEIHVIDAEPIARPVDTTGAGDQYAAGAIYGLTNGFSLAAAGRLGSLAATEVISHIGPRPARSLNELVAELG